MFYELSFISKRSVHWGNAHNPKVKSACSFMPMTAFLEHNGLDSQTYFHKCPNKTTKWRGTQNGGRQMVLCIHDVPVQDMAYGFLLFCVIFSRVIPSLCRSYYYSWGYWEDKRSILFLPCFSFLHKHTLFGILLWWGAVSAHCLGGQGTRTISLAFKLLQQRQHTRLNFLFYLS